MADTATDTKTDQYSEIPQLGAELGVSETMPFSTPFRPSQLGLVKSPKEQDLQEVLRDEFYENTRPSVRQLVTMRRLDGHARALYRLLVLPIMAALSTATFDPADGGEEEAEFVEAVFKTPPAQGGMTVTLSHFFAQLLGAFFEGFSAFEKVFWMPEFGPLKGKYTLKKLAYRPADTITFVADRTGGFAGLRQRTVAAGGKVVDVFIDPEYAFYFAAQEEERKFYGVSFFESAFPHYDAKAKTYYTAHLAAQRAAVGTRIGTVPPNASKAAKDEFARNLGNLAMAQWMMVPEGFKVDLLKESGGFDFLNLINHHNHMMSESVLANFFDKDSGGGSGESGALVNFAQPGDDMFLLMLRSVMNDIANSINHYIIPQLIDYNFDDGKYPTFTWGSFTEEQRQAIATTFDKLATAGAGINVSKEFMRELEKTVASEMGLSIDWDEVEAREAEEAAAAAGMVPGVEGDSGMLPGDGSDTGDVGEVEDLSDVLRIMAQKADAAAGITSPAPSQPTGSSLVAPTKAAQTPDLPAIAQPVKKAGAQVKLSGITDDMIDWANHMVSLTGEDWSDG